MPSWLRWPSWVNWNSFRSFLTWAAGANILVTLSALFGCSELSSGAYFCSATWMDPKYNAALSFLLLALNQLMKANQGGVFGAGLVAPTVVVSTSGAVGTATPQQVAEGPPK